jgi:uncharacterized membrane-anchored protein
MRKRSPFEWLMIGSLLLLTVSFLIALLGFTRWLGEPRWLLDHFLRQGLTWGVIGTVVGGLLVMAPRRVTDANQPDASRQPSPRPVSNWSYLAVAVGSLAAILGSVWLAFTRSCADSNSVVYPFMACAAGCVAFGAVRYQSVSRRTGDSGKALVHGTALTFLLGALCIVPLMPMSFALMMGTASCGL